MHVCHSLSTRPGALGRRARKLTDRIDEIAAAISESESVTSELETMFADPGLFADRAQMEASGERYQALKAEEHNLWEEWERLSMEAEDVERSIEELKAAQQNGVL